MRAIRNFINQAVANLNGAVSQGKYSRLWVIIITFARALDSSA